MSPRILNWISFDFEVEFNQVAFWNKVRIRFES